MATVQAKLLGRSLQKAKTVGKAEVDFNLDGMDLVIQNLRPDQYVSANTDSKELEDIEYLTEWRRSHICRAIVEIDGVNLRDVDYIEDEVEDAEGKPKRARFERHVWVRDNIVGAWGKEAVDVAFRKFTEVVEKAEKKAADGVVFVHPDESAEDKFRRLLGEALEVSNDVPDGIVSKIYEDLGLISKSTVLELEQTRARLNDVRAAVEAPVVEPVAVVKESTAPVPAAPVPSHIRRTPLNRTAPVVEVVPAHVTPPAEVGPAIPLRGRAAEYAALEQTAMEAITTMGGAVDAPAPQLSGSTSVATPAQLQRLKEANLEPLLIDQPPTPGINTRFRPAPPR
jgi:hypothetical protein